MNWFLCVFIEALPVKAYLHIWDVFLFEGMKVLFRYAIAIFKCLEEKLLQQNDHMSIFNTFKAELESFLDITQLNKVAFNDLNPFPMRQIRRKRDYHLKIIMVQQERLQALRENYKRKQKQHQSEEDLEDKDL